MPHVDIQCFPGRTDEQKKECAGRVAEDVSEVLGCKLSSVSVAIRDVEEEAWKEKVWDACIMPSRQYLNKEPGYVCDGPDTAKRQVMTVPQVLEKMTGISDGNLRDINHFMQVWAYAKMIGEQEGLDPQTQFILEVAALTHDIACPLCRKKYGHADGKHQEKEGAPMVRAFLDGSGMEPSQIERVAYLVGHHHTLAPVDGDDYQILLEADYIVNAAESGYSRNNIENFISRVMRTESGKRITRSVFRLDDSSVL